MDVLLVFNGEAALVGDLEGQVRTETRPDQLSLPDWEGRLRSVYLEPEHGFGDEAGVPFTDHTGEFRWEDGQVKVVKLEGFKPYETFADEARGLSVRAVFMPHLNQWVVSE
jgi:hypothetical protein